ncbi:MAG: hypothetical protein L0211_10890 [Planctomycetaceae bacterium]|nr:hypothetical protein [Planctomycetaceae bacterium]
MSAQYLLPCACGQKVRVEPAQAGGQVACACGAKLYVPTLRGLRQLEAAPPDKSVRSAGRQWGPVRGAMFSIGLLVTVISLLVLAYTYLQFAAASDWTQDQTPLIHEAEGQAIEKMGLMESLEAFYILRNEGLGEPVEPFWVTAQKVVAEKRALMIGAGSLALAGAIAAIASLLIRPARA